jgi:hypothetical protein
MLVFPIPRRESMNKQGLLFGVERAPWIDRLWRAIDPKRSKEVRLLLTQMAQRALATPAALRNEEQRDES